MERVLFRGRSASFLTLDTPSEPLGREFRLGAVFRLDIKKKTGEGARIETQPPFRAEG